jgi:hypothetical protein
MKWSATVAGLGSAVLVRFCARMEEECREERRGRGEERQLSERGEGGATAGEGWEFFTRLSRLPPVL